MKRNLAPLAAMLALAALPLEDAMSASQAPERLVLGNTQFALALYGRLAAREKGNLFLSPYSISSALAMTFAGARGLTQREMAAALHFPESGEALHASFGRLTQGLNALGKGGKVELSVANALWGQKGSSFLPGFIDLGRRSYGAGLSSLDFRSDPEGARAVINAWVEKETRRKIKDLVPSGALGPRTRLVLTNAVYFKGSWARQFEKAATREEPFTLPDGAKAKAPLMRQEAEFGYAETPELQALELPYSGKELSMVVVLPRKADGLPALERVLDERRLAGWLAGLASRKVEVVLPRFKVTAAFQLNEPLIGLGMPSAFKLSEVPLPDEADFSGMTGGRHLFISAALHKAFVDVNEEGTEAAAATAVLMAVAESVEPPTPVFRADHPFLFLIRDRRDGTVLFLGRLADPRLS